MGTRLKVRRQASDQVVVASSADGKCSAFALLAIPVLAASSSAVPTVITAVIAAISAFVAFLSLRLTAKTRSEAIEEKRIAQVSRVFVVQRCVGSVNGQVEYKSTVYNQSDLPIWDVDLRPRYFSSGTDEILPSTPPDLQSVETIPPHDTFDFKDLISEDDAKNRGSSPALYFVDARRQRWERVGDEFQLLSVEEHDPDLFVAR